MEQALEERRRVMHAELSVEQERLAADLDAICHHEPAAA